MGTVLDRPATEEWADELDDGDESDAVIEDEPEEEPLPVSALALEVANDLAEELIVFARPAKLGKVYTEMMFRLPSPAGRNRRPDVAFVPYSRRPRERAAPEGRALAVVPDLCVEVVSPTDRAEEVRAKVVEYFAVGVRLVWVLYPVLQLADVFEAADRVRVLGRADALDGGPVLPGFTLPLAELFPSTESGVVTSQESGA